MSPAPCKPATPLVDATQRTPLLVSQDTRWARHRLIHTSLRLLALALRLLRLKLTGRLTRRRLGQELRRTFEHLGVLWIKIGQHLSMRADLFSPETCRELASLTDRVTAFSGSMAVRSIERELGKPLFYVFSEFEKMPLAAASTAQVHLAVLRDEQVRVAVKVMRPGIEEIYRNDIRLLRFLIARLLQFSILPFLRWDDLLWEIEQVMEEELDYRYEAANLTRMQAPLARHGVGTPNLFGRYCTARLLVMEFVEGPSMSDYLHVAASDPTRLHAWLQQNNVDPALLARNLFGSYFRQVLEDNLFHCDLHPGNIILLRDSRFTLIDFGSVGFCSRDFLRKYRQYLEASFTGQYAKAVDYFLLISCYGLPRTDLAEMKREMVQFMLDWGTRFTILDLPYDERCFSALGDRMLRCVAKYDVPTVWSTLRIVRGMATMDASLRVLAGDVNLADAVVRYFEERDRRRALLALLPLSTEIMNPYLAMSVPSAIEEYAELHAGVLRRRLRVFENYGHGRSPVLCGALRLSAWIFAASAVVAIAGLDAQHGFGLSSRAFADVPALDTAVWWLVILGLVLSGNAVRQLRSRILA